MIQTKCRPTTGQFSQPSASCQMIGARLQTRSIWLALLGLFVLLGVIVLSAPLASAQRTGRADRSTRDKRKQTEPRAVQLKTKDGIELRAAYLESDQEKSAIPVLIIHEWQGQGSPYMDLAKTLNKAGHAVLVPEYRGHGGSRQYVDRAGRPKTFNPDRMGRLDIEAIVKYDLEAAKKFLKGENNEGKLNLNALVVIGVREGSILAAHWSQRDWAFPSVGALKQGQDVKAMIFVSPRDSFKGVAMDQVLRNNLTLLQLPIMMIAGRSGPDAADAKRLVKQVGSAKKRMGGGSAKGFAVVSPRTSLSGQALINQRDAVANAILKFIENEVDVDDERNEWIERK